jgi:hypothetical protein
MLAVNCPNCGAEVIFRSPALPVKVCDYCRTSVMRIGDEIRKMGEAAVLPFDVSPIQIGTAGKFFGNAFDIIGRVRWGWSDGSWNEWLALFGDGGHGWLGEAMGQFMMTRERALDDVAAEAIQHMAKGRKPKLNDHAQIDGIDYRVADIKQATCIAAEGELPFVAPTGWTITSVDMRSPGGELASFQTDGEGPSLYTGRYIELGDLQPTNLRDIAGWKIPRFA